MIVASVQLLAQADEWVTDKTNDGITVRHRIYNRVLADGKEAQVIQYVAATTGKSTLAKLISVVADVSKHKDFMNQKTSIKVKTLSENECVVYYYYKGFWPYPSSDIVAKMIFHEDVSNRKATFSLTAEPTLVEDKGVRRLHYYELTYLFNDLGDGNINIVITSTFTPAVSLPAFIASTWFPEGPAGYINGLLKLAKN